MPVRLPAVEQIPEIAQLYKMHLTEEDAQSFRGLMAGPIASYGRVDELAEPRPRVKYSREPGYRPPPEENPYNAWYWRCEIRGAKDGVLAGKTVAVKDNICIAGVPMMSGSQLLEGYVPEIDATVVERILDAGGPSPARPPARISAFRRGAIPAPPGPSAILTIPSTVRGFVRRQRRSGRGWRGRHGARWGPGRLDPHAVMLVRCLRAKAHLGTGADDRRDADLLLGRPLRPDLQLQRERCPPAYGDRRARPDGSARTQDYMGALGEGVRGLGIAVLKEGFAHEVSDRDTSTKVRAAIDEYEGARCRGRGGLGTPALRRAAHLDGDHPGARR
jgi:amidase